MNRLHSQKKCIFRGSRNTCKTNNMPDLVITAPPHSEKSLDKSIWTRSYSLNDSRKIKEPHISDLILNSYLIFAELSKTDLKSRLFIIHRKII